MFFSEHKVSVNEQNDKQRSRLENTTERSSSTIIILPGFRLVGGMTNRYTIIKSFLRLKTRDFLPFHERDNNLI